MTKNPSKVKLAMLLMANINQFNKISSKCRVELIQRLFWCIVVSRSFPYLNDAILENSDDEERGTKRSSFLVQIQFSFPPFLVWHFIFIKHHSLGWFALSNDLDSVPRIMYRNARSNAKIKFDRKYFIGRSANNLKSE